MQPLQHGGIPQTALLPLALEPLDYGFLQEIVRGEGSGRGDDLHAWPVYVVESEGL